jgi:hypothetical protein
VEFALRDRRELGASRAFWTAVIKSKTVHGSLVDLIRDHAVAEIRQDRDLMLLACAQQSEVFGLIGPHFQQDEDFLRTMIEARERAGYTFTLIPLPDLTVQAIDSELVEDFSSWVYLERQIAPDLWTDPEVIKAYVDHNVCCIQAESVERHALSDGILQVPAETKDVEDFGLYAAESCRRYLSENWYWDSGLDLFTSESLRENKSFMMKAVAINPRCRTAATRKLVEDFDLDVISFSQKLASIAHWFPEDEDQNNSDFEKGRSFAAKAREKLLLFEWYTDVFAPIFGRRSAGTNAPPGCHLQELFQHDETAQSLKKEVLEHCGVPGEEQVKNLRKASLYLLFVPHETEDHLLRGISKQVMPEPDRFFSCD